MTDDKSAPPTRHTRVCLYAELMAGVVVLPPEGRPEAPKPLPADGVKPRG
jgi:hypothetical protein